MQMTLHAFGSRGDVQPYIALGQGLMAAGHSVSVNTHTLFESLVRDNGLAFSPISGDPRQVLLSQAVADIGSNPIKLSQWLRTNFKPHLDEIFRETLAAAHGADLLLISSIALAAWHVAQKLQIPAIGLGLQPFTPTPEFPGSMAAPPPGWLPFKGVYNYLSAKLGTQATFSMMRPLLNESWASVLDLPPLSRRYYWQMDSPRSQVPFISGFSPSVVPRPANWGPAIQIAGYWFLDASQDYEPPSTLRSFLEAGSPPVYVGFGSMVDHDREKMTRLVAEAVRLAGQRAILLGGWSELGSADLPDFIFRVASVPHDWLFPRVAAVVHHGGAGTTAAGLRAGKPTVVVPFFGDQAFWAWRVHQLGAGPRWVPRTRLTAEKLAASMQRAVEDAAMRQRANELGARIRAEDGIATGVALIEQFARMDLKPP
jgi:sterol 3beta-glucosyltransferase